MPNSKDGSHIASNHVTNTGSGKREVFPDWISANFCSDVLLDAIGSDELIRAPTIASCQTLRTSLDHAKRERLLETP